jgi:protein-tyrosine phosphatase
MSPPRPFRVLFVCLGNICRSPAAEIIFRHQIREVARSADFLVDSAGTIGLHHGAPPDPRMAAALERKGFAVSGNSRQIKAADLEHFDLVLTMDEANFSDVQKLAPEHSHKIRPFVSYCRNHTDLRVPDPYYGGQRGFDHVIALLEDGCAGILESLQAGNQVTRADLRDDVA